MLISEAITLLKESEIKQLKVKDDVPTLIGYVNMGVLELHKRFNLWNEEAIITMVLGTKRYLLDGTDANVTMDLSDHSLLLIEEVYEETGEQMSLNNELDPYGAATPRWNELEVVEEVDGQLLSVIYRAAPKFAVADTEEIPLPPQFTEALFHYVGYRAHASVKGDEQSENNTHYKRFEASCGRINFHGLVTPDSLESTKFETRGFV